MDRNAVRDTVLAALAVLLVLGAAASGAVMMTPVDRTGDGGLAPADPQTTTMPPQRAEPSDLVSWIMAGLGVIFAVLVVLAIVQALTAAREPRRARRQLLPKPQPLAEGETVRLVQTEQDEAEQERALTTGTPRNGIVAVWVRLERTAHEAGFDRLPSETAADLVHRVLEGANVRPEAVATLADLYREARFSEHDITEEHRYAALEALWAIQADLRGVRRR